MRITSIVLALVPLTLAIGQAADNAANETKVKELTALIEKDGKNAQLYLDRGIAWHQLGKNDEAVTDFSKCIELSKSAPAFTEDTATAAAEEGGKVGTMDAVLGPHTRILRATYWRGVCYKALGKSTEAKNDFLVIAKHLGNRDK